MEQRVLRWNGTGVPIVVDEVPPQHGDRPETGPGWTWVDVRAYASDQSRELDALVALLGLDALAAYDALHELDLPKVDDFGHHLLLVLHELAHVGADGNGVGTTELDCFLTPTMLITVSREGSASVEALWHGLQLYPELAAGGIAEVAARLADGVSRRLLAIVDAFDERLDGLVADALIAASTVLADVSAVRSDLAVVRRVVHPQREMLDQLRTSTSPLLTDRARRRFADVFDVANRTAAGLDASRSALAETLDAYRGAEARNATEVTKVLTVYAATMLPITLVASFFGMNHRNLPTLDSEHGWLVVTAFMVLIAVVSLGVFVVEGWVRRPSGRRAGMAIGRGLAEVTHAPAHLAGAVLEISTVPLRRSPDAQRGHDDRTTGPGRLPPS